MPKPVVNALIPSPRWLMLYLACFIGCSVVFQLDPDAKPPWIDGSPIEYFTGTLLWVSSILSLVIAESGRGARRVLWLAISAGFALLAIDEIFLLHEHSVQLVGNDDHWKLVQWIGTGFALWFLQKSEQAGAETKWTFLIGYLFHTLYVAVDFGDGDYYTLRFASPEVLGWLEEYLELFALSAYFVGVLYLLTRQLVRYPLETRSESDNLD